MSMERAYRVAEELLADRRREQAPDAIGGGPHPARRGGVGAVVERDDAVGAVGEAEAEEEEGGQVIRRPLSRHGSARRSIALADYAPPGRALHLVDLENLAGGRFRPEMLARARDWYLEAARPGPADHVVVAVNPGIMLATKLLFPHVLVMAAPGADGADLALLDYVRDPCWICPRYERIVIGSGDHIFGAAARCYRELGFEVEVIARQGALAQELRRSATGVRMLSPPLPSVLTKPTPGVGRGVAASFTVEA